MKLLKNFFALSLASLLILSPCVSRAQGQDYSNGQEDPNKKIIKNGLLGAATGAIASGASGGNAGKGALIGAGTNVVGGALLDSLTGPSQPAPQQVQYVQQQPVYQQAPQVVYQQAPPQPVYVQQQQPVYYSSPAPQPDPNRQILRNGLLGAGTGAIAAGASGGNAGKGALIGAGTNVIGGALLDSLMPSQPAPQQVQYVQQPVYQQQQPYQQSGYSTSSSSGSQLHKKIIRKYDKDGNVVSEEEVWE